MCADNEKDAARLNSGGISDEHEVRSLDQNIPEVSQVSGFREPALAYGRLGLPVMPLDRFSNVPHKRLLGAFGHFEDVGSTDAEQIRAWWTDDKVANIGVVTGQGLLVLDIDMKNGVNGFRSLLEWEFETGIELPSAMRSRTPSGGAHLWFRTSEWCPSPRGWLPGVDVRADGAVVAVPPSHRRYGSGPLERYVGYTWQHGYLDCIPEAPIELVEAIKRDGSRFGSSRASSVLTGNESRLPSTDTLRLEGFRLGERDDGFHSLAWRLWRNHWPHEDLVRGVMYDVWLATDQGDDPYPWAEVEKRIERARAALEPDIRVQMRWAEGLRRPL